MLFATYVYPASYPGDTRSTQLGSGVEDETQIKEIFDYIDKDGDGEMDLQEFKEGFGYLKEKISQQRLARRPRPAPHSLS